MLLSFRFKINSAFIIILGCYAHLDEEDPKFFLNCKDILNKSEEKHGLIVGDLNTALDPILDRKKLEN